MTTKLFEFDTEHFLFRIEKYPGSPKNISAQIVFSFYNKNLELWAEYQHVRAISIRCL